MRFDPRAYGERRTKDGRSFFVPLFEWLWDTPEAALDGATVRMTLDLAFTYGTLWTFTGPSGCHPGTKRLARALRVDERNVRRRLAALRALGLIEWHSGGADGKATSTYSFLEPPCAAAPPGRQRPPGESAHPPLAPAPAHGGRQDPPGEGASAHQVDLGEPSGERGGEIAPAAPAALSLPLHHDLPDEEPEPKPRNVPRAKKGTDADRRLRDALADSRVIEILDFYRELHGKGGGWKPDAKEDRKPRAVWILDALEGNGCDELTVDEIKTAIRGNHADAWHASVGKHELSYVLRPAKVHGFIAAGKAPAKGPTRGPSTIKPASYWEANSDVEEALRTLAAERSTNAGHAN